MGWTTYQDLNIPDPATTPGDAGLNLTNDLKTLANRTSGTVGGIFFVGATGYSTQDFAQLFWDDTNDRLRINTTSDFTAAMNVSPKTASDKGLVIRGLASQTGNLFELQDSSGNALIGFTAAGNLTPISTADPSMYVDSRNFSTRFLADQCLRINPTFSWSGDGAGSATNLYAAAELSFTDTRTVTGISTITPVDATAAIRTNATRNSSFSSAGTTTFAIHRLLGSDINITDSGHYNNTSAALQEDTMGARIRHAMSYTVGATGQTFTYRAMGVDVAFSGTPTLSSGTLIGNYYGFRAILDGNTVGTSTGYGCYVDVEGYDTNYAFFNATAAHNQMGDDDSLSYFGTAPSASIGYDGTNLVINPKVAGSGKVKLTGDLALSTAGDGLYVKEGTNATMGVATLSSGTVTVNTTKVTANSRIFLTIQSPSGTVGTVYVSARSAGTSFTVTSTSGADASTVAWLIVEPA